MISIGEGHISKGLVLVDDSKVPQYVEFEELGRDNFNDEDGFGDSDGLV